MAEQKVTIIDGQARQEQRRRLRRSNDRTLAGVCGGLADYFDVDPGLMRLGWIVASLFTLGGALLVYGLLAIVLPDQDGSRLIGRRLAGGDWRSAVRENSVLLWALALMLVGALLLANNFDLLPVNLGRVWDTFWSLFWPLLLIGLGVVLLLPLFGKKVDLDRVRSVGARLPLRRSRHNRVIAGVCGGLAAYLRLDATLVRAAWVVLSILTVGTVGVLLYALAAILIPLED